MSVAVLEAVALGKQLSAALPPATAPGRLDAARSALPSVTRSFMRGIGGVVAVPWALATGSDAPYVAGFKRTALETMINNVFEEVA